MWSWKKIICVTILVAIIARLVRLTMPKEASTEPTDYKRSFSPRKEAVFFSRSIDEDDFADYTDEIFKYTQQKSEIARDENFKELTDILHGDLEQLDKVEDAKWAPVFQTPKLGSGSKAKQRAKADDHDAAPLGKGDTVNIAAAEFEVTQAHIDQLPKKLRVGLFAKPRVYPAIIRVSHADGSSADYMRLAVRLNMAEDPAAQEQWDQTTSFLAMESVPAFLARDLQELRTMLYMTDKTTGKLTKLFKILPRLSNVMAIKKEAGLLKDNLFDIITNTEVLAKDYYGCVPYALGASNIFKFKFASNHQVNNPLERGGHLTREETTLMGKQVSDFLSESGTSFDFQIQIATDKSKHDINCASCFWGKQGVEAIDIATDGHYRGGYITMGKLRVVKQTLTSVEEEGAYVNSELDQVLPNSKVLYFNSGNSPFPPVGDVQLFRAWTYDRYNAKYMSFVLGEKTEEMEDHFFDRKIVGEDKYAPIRGGASANCPFSTILQSLSTEEAKAEEPVSS